MKILVYPLNEMKRTRFSQQLLRRTQSHFHVFLLVLLSFSFVQICDAQLHIEAGANSTICAGTGITLGGVFSTSPSAWGGSGNYNYQWTPNIFINNNLIDHPIVNPPYSITFKLKVKDITSNDSLVDSVTITVSPVVPAFSIFSSPDPQQYHCPNDSVILYTNLTNQNLYSFQWLNNGFPIFGATNSIYYAKTTGTYSLRLTYQSFPCYVSSTNSKLLTFAQSPDGSYTYSPSSLTACDSSSFFVTFTNTSTTIATNAFYEINWDDGGGIVSLPNNWANTSHNYTSQGYHYITYTVTGASPDYCKTTKHETVYIGSIPQGNLTNPGATIGCAPLYVSYPISPGYINNPAGTQYTVKYSDGSSDEIYSQSNVPSAISHTFYKSSCGTNSDHFNNAFQIQLFIDNPCGAAGGTLEPIVVKSRPKVKFTATPTTYCTGKPITFTSTVDSANWVTYQGGNYVCSKVANLTWQVTPSTGFTLTSGGYNLASITLNFTIPGTYIVKLSGNNGCGTGIYTDTICVAQTPQPSFTPGSMSFCAADTISFHSTSVISVVCGNETYQWNVLYTNPGNCPVGAAPHFWAVNGTSLYTANSDIYFKDPGVYNITLSVTNNCGTVTTNPATVITVKGPPNVTAISNPTSSPLCGSVSLHPTATVIDCYGTSTYSWTSSCGTVQFPTSLIPGTWPCNIPGSQTITLTATNECGSASKTTPAYNLFPFPKLDTIPSFSYCTGFSVPSLVFSGTPAGVTYTWIRTAGSIGLIPTTGGVNVPAFIASIPGSSPVTVTFTVIPHANGCDGTPRTFTITINPIPTVSTSISTQTLCSGDITSINITNPNAVTGTSFNWVATLQSGTATGFSNGSGISISQTLFNSTNAPAVVKYSITPTANNCPGAQTNVLVTINPIPNVAANPPFKAFCSNSSTNISITNPNGVAGTTFSWTAILQSGTASGFAAGVGNSINQTLVNVSNTIAVIKYTITPKANNCNGIPIIVIDTVIPEPLVAAMPASQGICSGGITNIVLSNPNGILGTTFSWTAVLQSGTATGFSPGTGPLIAQTLTNTTNTSAVVRYTISPLNNPCNGANIIVDITVYPIPIVTASTSPICSGLPANITLNSTVTGTVFTWTASLFSGNATGFSNNSGPVIAQTLTNVTNTPAVVSYLITPTANLCPGTPTPFFITINPIPDAFVSPTSESFCSGATTNILISNPNSVVGTTFTWTAALYSGTASGFTGGSGSTISQTLLNSTSSIAVVRYTIKPSAANCPGTAVVIDVTVKPIPIASAAPASPNLCSGDLTNILLSSTVTGTTFSWTASLQSGVASGFSDASGSSITQTLINTSNTPALVRYIIVPVANGCTGIPITVNVTVNPIPDISISPTTLIICSGVQTSINITNPNSVTGTTFSWVASLQSGTATGFSSNSGNIILQTLVNNTNAPAVIRYVITPKANNCPGIPVAIDVTVNPIPKVSANPPSQSICSGDQTAIIFTNLNSVIGTTFAWTAVLTTGIASGYSNGSVSPISQVLFNSTNTNAVVTYAITPTANNCPGNPLNVPVTVKPIPNISTNITADTICSGTPTAITMTNPNAVSGTVYAWSASLISGTASFSPGGSGSPISQMITNNTNVAAIVRYTITPTANSCLGTPAIVDITVNPLPTVSLSPTVQALCSGGTTSIAIANQNGVSGTAFSWTATLTSGTATGFSNGTGNNISQTLTNTLMTPALVTYAVRGIANGCQGPAAIIKVTVNPKPLANANINQSIPYNTSTTLNGSLSMGLNPLTYSWSPAGQLINASVVNPQTTQLIAPTLYTLIVIDPVTGCVSPPDDVLININGGPLTFMSMTATPSTICVNQSTTVNVTVSGGGSGIYSYTWGSIPAAYSNTTTVPSITVSPIANITYTVTVTDGNQSVNGSTLVTVNPRPNVIASPGSQAICSGQNTDIGLSSTSGISGTSFSWTASLLSGTASGFSSSGGTNTITQTLYNASNTPAVVRYIITATANNCPGAPINVNVTVNPIPDVNALPVSQSLCSGLTTAINITNPNNVSGTSFSWVAVLTSGTASGFSNNGGTHIIQTLMNSSSSPAIVTYTIVPVANSCQGIPIIVPVTINPIPNVKLDPVSQMICSHETTSINISNPNGVSGTSFSWTAVLISGTATGYSNGSGTNIIQAIDNVLNIPAVVRYTVSPTANLCSGTPAVIDVTINPIPDISATPLSQILCSNNVTSVNVTNPNGISGTTFSWSAAVTNGTASGFSNGAGNSLNQTLFNVSNIPATVTYTITPIANTCPGAPIAVPVTINPIPTVAVDPTAQVICSNSTTSINITNPNNVSGTTFAWLANLLSGTASGFSNGGGTSITQTIQNPSNTPAIVEYIVTPSANGCPGTPGTFQVTINAIPDIAADPAIQTICSGTSTAIFITNPNGVGGAAFNWIAALTSGTVTGFSNSSGSLISQTLYNASNNPGVVTYTITPSANNCPGMPIGIPVTVNPIPNILVTPSADTLCSGEMTNISFSNPNAVSGIVYQWTANLMSGTAGGFSAGSGSGINQTLNNGTSIPAIVRYTVTPSSNGCLGIPSNVDIMVNPLPNPTIALSPLYPTVGAPACLNVAASASYIWSQCAGIILPLDPPANMPSVCTGIIPSMGTYCYCVTVTNEYGCSDTASRCFIVDCPPITSTSISATPDTICSGQSISLNVSINGGENPFEFYWNAKLVFGTATNYLPAPGSVNPLVQTINNFSNTYSIVRYVVVFHDSCNLPRTDSIDVLVYPNPTIIASSNTPICDCDELDLTSAAQGGFPPYSYQWTHPGSNPPFGSPFSKDTISQACISSGYDGKYFVTVTDTNRCIASTFINIIIHKKPKLFAIPQQVICSGDSTTKVYPQSPDPVTKYYWSSTDPAAIPDGYGFAAAGIYIPSYQVSTPPDTPKIITINVVGEYIEGNVHCMGDTLSFIVIVVPEPRPITTFVNNEICSPWSTLKIILPRTEADTNENFGYYYTWRNTNPSIFIGLQKEGIDVIPAVNTINNTCYPISSNFYITPHSICKNGVTIDTCDWPQYTFTVIVNPKPEIDPVADQVVCCKDMFAPVIFTGTCGFITTYHWNLAVNDGPDIGLTYPGAGNISPFTGINTLNVADTNTIKVWPVAYGCIGPADTFNLTVMPCLHVTNYNAQILCNGQQSTAQQFVCNVAGAKFTWTCNNASIGCGAGFIKGTGTFPSFTAQNLTNECIVATITIIPSIDYPGHSCTGDPVTFTLTVLPQPRVNPINPTNSIVACVGSQICIPGFTSPTYSCYLDGQMDITYEWICSPGIGILTGSGNIACFTAWVNGSPQNPFTATVTVTPLIKYKSWNCPGLPMTFTITINPIPVFTITPFPKVCEGQAFNLVSTISSGNAGPFTSSVSSGCFETVSPLSTLTYPILNTPIPGITPPGQCILLLTIKDAASCENTLSINIVVDTVPSVNAILSTQCSGKAFSVKPANISGGQVPSGTKYSWAKPNVPNISGGPGGINQPAITDNLTNSTNVPINVNYAVTPTSGFCQGAPFVVTITVDPTPQVSPISAASICTGATGFIVNPVNGLNGIVPASTTYSWASPTGGTGGTSQASISDNPINSGILPITISYSVTPTSGSCEGNPFLVAVEVLPRPLILNAQTVSSCSGSAFNWSPVAGSVPTTTTYTWGVPTGIPTGGMPQIVPQNAVSQVLSHFANVAQIETYSILPSAGFCPGNAFSLQVYVNPRPKIDSINYNACSGIPFTVTPVNSTNGIIPAGTTYSWQSPGGIGFSGGLASGGLNINGSLINTNTTQVPAFPIFNVSPLSGNCSGTAFHVHVKLNPEPQIDFGTHDTAICANANLNIWAPRFIAHNFGNVSWTTNGDGTFTSASIVNPTYFPGSGDLVAGMVDLSLTANGVIPCQGITDVLHLVIHPQTIAFAGNDDSICQGDTIQIANSSSIFANSWHWTSSSSGIAGCGTFGNADSLYTTYIPGPYDIWHGSVNLCLSAENTTYNCGHPIDCATITINPLPILNASNDTSICKGQVAQLHANGGDAYFWTPFSLIGSDNTLPDIITIPLNGSTMFHVSGVKNGCSNIDSVMVIVNQLPIVSAGNNASICQGQIVTLNASGGIVYIWNTVPNPTSGNPLIVNPSTTTIYCVTATDNKGCKNDSCMTLTVNPLPTITVLSPKETICRDSSLVLTATGANTYLWLTTYGFNSDLNSNPITVSPLESHSYPVKGTDNNGCSDVGNISIEVVASPNVFLPSQLYLCEGNSIVIDAGYSPSTSYNWSNGNTSQQITANYSGIYWLKASNTGCSIIDTTVVETGTVVWVPNAFSPDGDGINEVFLAFEYGPLVEFHLYIFSRWGELIFQSDNIKDGWDGTYKGQICPMNTYAYRIDYIAPHICLGSSKSSHTLTGTVTLLR
ncbi:MAG: PKD-like domain-containing protein [Bacteroidota bacterium]